MKHKLLIGLILIGILKIPSVVNAQELGNQKINNALNEENNLKFQTYFFEALKQKAINNSTKAIENLEKCYEIDATNKAVEFEFSKNYLILKKYFEAEIFIDKALAKDTKNVYLLAHKVAIYKAQRNFLKAIEIQKKLTTIHPKYASNLVLLYLQNKEYSKAEKLITKIEENALSTSKIKGYKAYLQNRKQHKKASEEHKSKVISSDLNSLKKQYKENKNYKILRQILENEKQNALFDLLYSDSKQALELFPSQPYLYQINGLALNKLTKYNEAIAVLTIGIDFVIENKTMEANFYNQLAIAHEGLKNVNKALKFKQKVKKLRQEN